MKLAIAALLLLGAITQAHAQQTLGFSPSDTPGPTIKLQGIIVRQVNGEYLAYSFPLKDIKRVLEVVRFLEPHYDLFFVLESLSNDAQKFQHTPGLPTAQIGPCFLFTNEILPRLKILDRNVQAIGTYTCTNRSGRMITVQVYSGGPTR